VLQHLGTFPLLASAAYAYTMRCHCGLPPPLCTADLLVCCTDSGTGYPSAAPLSPHDNLFTPPWRPDGSSIYCRCGMLPFDISRMHRCRGSLRSHHAAAAAACRPICHYCRSPLVTPPLRRADSSMLIKWDVGGGGCLRWASEMPPLPLQLGSCPSGAPCGTAHGTRPVPSITVAHR
jgi:hypothetical protein